MAHKEKMISTLKTKADMIEAEINDLNNFVKNFVEKILKEASGYEELDTEKFKTKHAQLEYIWNALFNVGINFINFENSDTLLPEPTLSVTKKDTSEWLQKEKQLSMRVSRLEQQTENTSRNSNDQVVKQAKKIETQDMKITSLEQQVEFIKNKLGLFSKGPENVPSTANKVEQNFQFLHQLNPPPNMMNYIQPQFNQVPTMYQRGPTPPFLQGNQTIINQKPMLNAVPQQMVPAPMPGMNFNPHLHQQHGMPPTNVVPFLPGNFTPMPPSNVASLFPNNVPHLHPGNVAHLLPVNPAQLLPDKTNQENEQSKGNTTHLTGTPVSE
ncbi:arp2/3 complex-activating protein rickA-like [Physella acuta]|uniref:arp2/3 complex-activating protein rickA-like n=1 Tax=Physella acuta TaxID=109671 RepID=UPI0027DE25D6|nr:arp2/3 complex-activating protein rickA-like [Physella acuta]